MKVLTLHQPWASLVALGVKTIETRPWSTKHRGPLAIHAAGHPTEPDLLLYSTLLRSEKARGVPCARCRHTESIHTCRMVRTECLLCGCDGWTYGGPPLGAIVATCTLVDVVPIVEFAADPQANHITAGKDGRLRNWEFVYNSRPLAWRKSDESRFPFDVTDQRPYGDFTPGRYAWLLADVVPVDPPVPFKGGQGLSRSWEPEEAAA